jgi:predicted transposase YbfD/YdcC
MPAAGSSPVPAAVTGFDHVRPLAVGECPGLLGRLAMLPDPRDRRGRRHPLASVLAVSAAAVAAGARSVTAIAEWATDAPGPVLAALGVRCDPLTRRCRVPGEATIRRVLARVDGDRFDRAVGAWLADRLRPPGHRRVIAVDGKRLRGSARDGHQVHLLAALDHHDGAVLAQREVPAATNEIAQFQPLLAGLDLASVVVTADALHTQRDHASFLVDGGAEDLLVVKANQPTLHAQLAGLPWRTIPVMDRTREHGHGRVEVRTLKVAAVAGLCFPHAAQAIQVTRRVRAPGSPRWRTVTVYAVTSLALGTASPAQLAGWLRGHWRIENQLHWVRDVTFGDDASTARSGSLPARWPACVTSPSGRCGWPATPTSPPRCDTPAATLPGRLPSSAWRTNETTSRHFDGALAETLDDAHGS